MARGVTSEIMTATTASSVTAALVAAMVGASQLIPATTWAQPEPEPTPAPDKQLYNVIYRARVDGVARGATIRYRFDDAQVQTADPSMLPGRIFEATGVVSDPGMAGMTVAVDWPYSANLHCEILVNDAIVAQADEFIAPRAFPVRDDPLYATLQCGASLDTVTGLDNVVNTDPVAGEPAPVETAPAP